MTILGNIQKSYGKTFNAGIANTYSSIVLSGANLPENSFIISSNVDSNYDDTGAYSLIVTDSYGNPVRLTYAIQQGNGLTQDANNADVIRINIDDKYIKNNSSGIHVDLSSFIKDNVSINDENKFYIDTSKLTHAELNKRGIVKVDNNTIISEDNVLRVNSSNLQLANNSTKQYGVVNSSDDIIDIDNGIISLNESNLPISNEDNFGLSKGDEYTISVNDDSSLNVNTNNLDRGDDKNYGIISVDNDKIISNNGLLSVNTNSLAKANYTNKGIISIDNDTIVINENNQITVNRLNEILSDIDSLEQAFSDMKTKFNELKDEILSQINE